MDLLEKYELFKKGLVPRNTNMTMQKFFKTEPTTDQLLYLQEMTRQNNAVATLGSILMLIYGIILGIALSILFFLPLFKV